MGNDHMTELADAKENLQHIEVSIIALAKEHGIPTDYPGLRNDK
jgi:hypothetical protein